MNVVPPFSVSVLRMAKHFSEGSQWPQMLYCLVSGAYAIDTWTGHTHKTIGECTGSNIKLPPYPCAVKELQI